MSLFKNIFIILAENYIFLIVLLTLIAYYTYKNLELKQKAYFADRNKESYNQILYATKDGYFSFFYPDQNIKDPTEHIKNICSRRLAVLLSLNNGTQSSFEDVLTNFSATDAKELKKAITTLKEDGLSFEKEFNTKKGKKLLVWGNKITDIEGNVFCDIVWFRDLSFSDAKQIFLQTSLKQLNQKNQTLENLFNLTPHPLWIRDEKLNIIYKNKAYQKICKEDDILNIGQDSNTKNLSLKASSTKKSKSATSSYIIDGKKQFFELTETPLISDLAQQTPPTYGIAINTTNLNELKRKLKSSQNHQLEIFTTLGTAFAVFDETQSLSFYNDAFLNLFKLEKIWAASKPNYSQFLDILREKRIIAETSVYQTYKKDELLAFETISSSTEDIIFLTDEKTLKRLRVPHSQGGLIFAFEDISSQISQQNQYTSLVNMQKDILNNIFDAVCIFAPDGKLSFYNEAFVELWQQDKNLLQTSPSIAELIDAKKPNFKKIKDWDALKKEFLEHIFDPSTKVFTISTDNQDIDITSKTMIDGSVIITYRQH